MAAQDEERVANVVAHKVGRVPQAAADAGPPPKKTLKKRRRAPVAAQKAVGGVPSSPIDHRAIPI